LLAQMNGINAVKDRELRILWTAAKRLKEQFRECRIEHVAK